VSKGERVALSALVGVLALLAGILDQGDPTPAVIRWPIVGMAAAGLAWLVWRLSRGDA